MPDKLDEDVGLFHDGLCPHILICEWSFLFNCLQHDGRPVRLLYLDLHRSVAGMASG